LNILIITLVALSPCIFWLWIIYKWDKYEPEPKSLIIRTFFLGFAIAIPVAIIEAIMYPRSLTQNPVSIASTLYLAFAVAGLTEELGKYLVVRRTIYSSRFFEEPSDGLVYSAAAALGFASLENIGYLFSFGWETILVRGLFSNVAHVLFSSLWGYPLALYKLGIIKARYIVRLGLLTAVVAHGAFDFLLLTENLYSLLAIPLFAGMVVLFILMMRHANKISPYRVIKN
jgi:RsiW-degrading membrane proteinase PrsW (M82 family)